MGFRCEVRRKIQKMAFLLLLLATSGQIWWKGIFGIFVFFQDKINPSLAKKPYTQTMWLLNNAVAVVALFLLTPLVSFVQQQFQCDSWTMCSNGPNNTHFQSSMADPFHWHPYESPWCQLSHDKVTQIGHDTQTILALFTECRSDLQAKMSPKFREKSPMFRCLTAKLWSCLTFAQNLACPD